MALGIEEIFEFPKKMPEDWRKSNEAYWDWSKQGFAAPNLFGSKCEVLYVSTFFMALAKSTNGVLVACDPFELQLCHEGRYPLINGMRWKAFIDVDIETAIEEIGKTILCSGARVVVLKNDQLYLERAIIWACRELRIPTIVMQHGILNSKAERFLNVGDWADERVVWGEWFKRLMNSYDLSAKVWTYPKVVTKAPKTPRSVCILGPTPRADVRKVKRACRLLNIPVSYRTHPSAETPSKRVQGIKTTEPKTPIWNDIKNHTHFISHMSTSLMEAGLAGRVSIQLYRDSMQNLQEAGCCYSIEPKVSTICDHLLNADPHGVREDYIRSTDNFIGDWKKILADA